MNLLDFFGWDMRILLAKMKQYWRRQSLFGVVRDPAPVVTNRRSRRMASRGQPGNGASKAVTNDADFLTGLPGCKLHGGDGVGKGIVHIHLGYEVPGAQHICALIA